MPRNWSPTHRIEMDNGAVYVVMLVEGAAYDQTEWKKNEKADFERGDDGCWTLNGKPFNGTVTSLGKETL